MGLPEARADLKLATDQIATAASFEELKAQLLDNLVPAVDGIATAASEELAARDEVIGTLIEDVEELQDDRGECLEPETAGNILGVFGLGGQLATELESLLKKVGVDDVTKKRGADLVKKYRKGVLVVTEHLADITIPVEEDEAPDAVGVVDAAVQTDDADDDDDDDEDDDGYDEDEDDDDDADDDEDDEDEQPAKITGGK